MLFRKKDMANNLGQSTIEFIISLGLMFSMIFLFMSLSYNYVHGFVVHWSVFRASRTFLVYERNSSSDSGTDGEAKNQARIVYEQSGLSENFIKNGSNRFQAQMPGDPSRLYGISLKFKQRFSMFSFFGGTDDLNLTSESYLGREPTKQTCLERVCQAIQSSSTCGSELVVTFFDNGC